MRLPPRAVGGGRLQHRVRDLALRATPRRAARGLSHREQLRARRGEVTLGGTIDPTGDWNPLPHFASGGVVILSSTNSILSNPQGGAPVVNLDRVGMNFTSEVITPFDFELVWDDRFQFQEGDPDAEPPSHSSVTRVVDPLRAMIDAGHLDVCVQFRALEPGQFGLIGAMHLVGGETFAAGLRELLSTLKAQGDDLNVTLDAEKHGDVRLHTIAVPITDPDTMAGHYANFANVSHSDYEFTLTFARVDHEVEEGEVPGVVVSRINLSPRFMRELIDAMEDNFSKWQTREGIRDLPEFDEPDSSTQ